MSRHNSKKSTDNWAAGILAEMSAGMTVEKVPPGWYTDRDLAATWGISRDAAGGRARTRVQNGDWVAKDFTIKAGRKTMPVTHYTLAKAAK